MLIRFENFPSIPSCYECSMAAGLQTAAACAGVPGIGAGQVTVVAGGRQLILHDKTLVVIVEALFDRPERTKEIRDRLARLLAEAAKERLPDAWKVEVFVKRFSVEKDSYFEINGT